MNNFYINNISGEMLDRFLRAKTNNIVVIDVRDSSKYMKMHIDGAVNITYEDILNGNYNIPVDKEIIVYCERGGMSMKAAKALISKGYRVYNLVGGIRNYRGKNIFTISR